jgi:hypothetical protein
MPGWPKSSIETVHYYFVVYGMMCMGRRRHFNAHVKRLVAARGEWKCAMCGEMLDETFDCDHVVALHLGGEDVISNLAALHSACHRKKTLQEEIARLAARQAAAETRSIRPPLSCTRCDRIISPYFVHTCPPREV